jgi:hypothetical protein
MGLLFGKPKVEAAPAAPSIADVSAQIARDQVLDSAQKKRGRNATVLAPSTQSLSVLAPPSPTFGGGAQ